MYQWDYQLGIISCQWDYQLGIISYQLTGIISYVPYTLLFIGGLSQRPFTARRSCRFKVTSVPHLLYTSLRQLSLPSNDRFLVATISLHSTPPDWILFRPDSVLHVWYYFTTTVGSVLQSVEFVPVTDYLRLCPPYRLGRSRQRNSSPPVTQFPELKHIRQKLKRYTYRIENERCSPL